MSARSVQPATIQGGVTLGASETDTVVSREVRTTGNGDNLRVEFKATSVTSATGITATLQHYVVDAWIDLTGSDAQASVTADGNYSIKIRPYSTTASTTTTWPTYIPDLPLGSQVRLVCTTGSGDAVTISDVRVIQAS